MRIELVDDMPGSGEQIKELIGADGANRSDADIEISNAVAWHILHRWKEKAKTADEFKRMYKRNFKKAQGAIVAIMELVKSVGEEGKS